MNTQSKNLSNESLKNSRISPKESLVLTPYSKVGEIQYVQLKIATSERVKQWTEKLNQKDKILGEVKNANTLHYKTFKPVRGGLFCERLFGPLKDFQCACGTIQKPSSSDGKAFSNFSSTERKFCKICEVEYTWSILRRYQLAYIELAAPVAHSWYLRGTPSYLALVLGIKRKKLEALVYGTERWNVDYAYSASQDHWSSSQKLAPSQLSASWQALFKEVDKPKKTRRPKSESEKKRSSVQRILPWRELVEFQSSNNELLLKKFKTDSFMDQPFSEAAIYPNLGRTQLPVLFHLYHQNSLLFTKKTFLRSIREAWNVFYQKVYNLAYQKALQKLQNSSYRFFKKTPVKGDFFKKMQKEESLQSMKEGQNLTFLKKEDSFLKSMKKLFLEKLYQVFEERDFLLPSSFFSEPSYRRSLNSLYTTLKKNESTFREYYTYASLKEEKNLKKENQKLDFRMIILHLLNESEPIIELCSDELAKKILRYEISKNLQDLFTSSEIFEMEKNFQLQKHSIQDFQQNTQGFKERSPFFSEEGKSSKPFILPHRFQSQKKKQIRYHRAQKHLSKSLFFQIKSFDRKSSKNVFLNSSVFLKKMKNETGPKIFHLQKPENFEENSFYIKPIFPFFQEFTVFHKNPNFKNQKQPFFRFSRSSKKITRLWKEKNQSYGTSRMYNPIYTLSSQYQWSFPTHWDHFSSYTLAPAFPSGFLSLNSKSLIASRDSLIPFYSFLVGSWTRSLETSLSSEFRHRKRVSALAFIGIGCLRALLEELDEKELLKVDRQNRVLLFELSESIQQIEQRNDLSQKSIQKQWKILLRVREGLFRRFKIIRKLVRKKALPKSMLITALPVLPPDLRPIIRMQKGIAASDLNKLYQRVIYRNERLKKLLQHSDSKVPFDHYNQRLLQEAVNNLIENPQATAEKDSRGRPLKSLSESLKGKEGRFRQHLLGKRVDYSGRSVIVVGPKLKLSECGLPKEIALELFLPFLMKALIESQICRTVIGAKALIQKKRPWIWALLEDILRTHPILLNRAPTLHRLGFQAFLPKLVEGRAILLHPLVCAAFNADFDGDQMAVHLPITVEARAEAWKFMFSRRNLLSPATGEPIVLPSQDMVLGCYYLTAQKMFLKNALKDRSSDHSFRKDPRFLSSDLIYTDFHEVLTAYEQQKLSLHQSIWVRSQRIIETGSQAFQPLELRIGKNGDWEETSLKYRYRLNYKGQSQIPIIHTTVGRLVFWQKLQNHLA